MNKDATTCLLWFLKAPIKGFVKSRLAVSIGEDHALALYCCFIRDLRKKVKTLSFPTRIYCTPYEERDLLIELAGEDVTYAPQKGKDLGERLLNAFQDTFHQGSENILVIGGDSPDLPDETFQHAQDALQQNDVVIGPAHDGGYYLLGIRRSAFNPSLFAGINWGNETVFDETLVQCEKLGIKPHILPLRHDVDTLIDVKTLFEENQHTSFTNSNTIEYVRKHLLDSKIQGV